MNTKLIVDFIMSLLTYHTTGSKSSSAKAPLLSSPENKPEKPDSGVPDKSPYYLEKDGYYHWNKGYVGRVSDHFSTRELTCRCSFPDCYDQRISKDLISRLEKVRTELGQPMVVTSAYRCSEHQAYLRASGVNSVVAKKSTHETGDAVDVVPKDKKMEGFETICGKHFDSIGLASNFLHLDTRIGHRRWKY